MRKVAEVDQIVSVDGKGKLTNGHTFHVPASAVLEHARKADLVRVMVVGIGQDGEIYASGTDGHDMHHADYKLFQRKLKAGDYDAVED
jgi:altronate dehydratase